MDDQLAAARACSIIGACNEGECAYLYRLAEQAPDGYPLVELGTLYGRTAYAIAAAGKKPVFTIDNFKDEKAFRGKTQMVAFLEARKNLAALDVIVLPASTFDVPCVIDRIGFLFVDTWHIRERLEKEINAWVPRLVTGGILALHDYNLERWPEMKPYIDEQFTDKPKEWERLGLVDRLIAFRRLE